MRTHYDPSIDALYLRFSDAKIIESEELKSGIVLDFDKDGRVVAIEVLDARTNMAEGTDLAALTAAE